jgi:hypothetical protein
MELCGYPTTHNEAEKDYKDASFKIQEIHAKSKNLGKRETLDEEDKEELELQRQLSLSRIRGGDE